MKAVKKHDNFVRGKVAAAVCAAVMLLISCMTFYGCGKRVPEDLYTIQKADLTHSDELALRPYRYDELSETVVTMRADTMYVTERGIKRPEVKILSDTYTVTADKLDGSKYINEFEFNKGYPVRNRSITANMFTEEAAAAGVSTADYLKYYRYMLHSQGYNLTRDAANKSAAGTLTQDDLYKHPAIDGCYGKVEDGDNAVEKVIIMDPSYRTYHLTGLYIPAGEAVTVKVEGLSAGKRVGMYTGLQNSMAWLSGHNNRVINDIGCTEYKSGDSNDNYFYNNDIIASAAKELPKTTIPAIQIHPHLAGDRYANRLPWIRSYFSFTENREYTIGTPFGGLLYIDPGTSYDKVKITVRGAVETPHYILGVTTPEYFDTYLRNAPGVFSAMDTENGQLLGPSAAMRNIAVEEIDKLAMLWHSFFSVNESFTGGTYNRKNFVKFDYCVPAGAAVALGNFEYACPDGWYYDAMNYRWLLSHGQWGILHEIGHSHGAAHGNIWGFGDSREGEVRNNALTCLAYLKTLDIGTYRNEAGNITNGAEHGFVSHPYVNLKFSLSIPQNKTDWIQNDYFQMLSMYVNIMHSFGVDKFYELLKTYKTSSLYVNTDGFNNEQKKRADFVYRCALVYGLDFREYFNKCYKANIPDAIFETARPDVETEQTQLEFLDSLETYQPVANVYAGGIDGVHTGGDWMISYGSEVILDIVGKTMSTDTFEITSVEQPAVGKLTRMQDGKYKYEFADKAYNRDVFYFTVKLGNGQKHKLEVTLRISGNTSAVEHYKGEIPSDLDAAVTAVDSLTPVMTAQPGGGVVRFDNAERGKNEVKISRFVFRAEEKGIHTFYLKADDKAIVRVGSDFNDLTERVRINKDLQNFSEAAKFSVELKKGEMLAFEIFLLNVGGGGFATLGLLTGAEEGVNNNLTLPVSQVFHPAFLGKGLPEQYIFEPVYLVSSKSGLSLGTLSTPKSEWKILEAPDRQGGNIIIESMHDPDHPDDVLEMEIDTKSYLIDGQIGSIYHTVYGNAATMPDKLDFVIDTGDVQDFNFFQVTTRNHNNSYIHDYELYLSSDNSHWELVSSGNAVSDKIYKSNVAKIVFDKAVRGRYWKLAIKSTSGMNSGKYFAVIAEFDAGVTSETQRVVPLTNTNLYTTSGWKDSRNIENMQSGLLVSKKKNSKLVMRFKGDNISFYANRGPGYGSAQVYIDGKKAGTIKLGSEEEEQKRLVFSRSGLEEKEHTVEIITLSNKPVNLCFAGLSYTAELVNAPNIYKEHALTVAMVVFMLLFAALTAFIVLSFCLPAFRKAIYGNKFVRNYDENRQKAKERKAAMKVEEKSSVKEKPATKTVAAEKAPEKSAAAEARSRLTGTGAGQKPARQVANTSSQSSAAPARRPAPRQQAAPKQQAAPRTNASRTAPRGGNDKK